VNQVTNANGVVTTYAMDPNHMARPASIATTAGWSTGAYAYDGAGNVTRIGNGRFLYDGVSRLLQGVTVTTPADSTTTRTQTVAYDLYGNIQSITTNGSTLNTPTNSANRLTSSGTAYDAAGNLITWNWGNTYQYDPFGLLWHYTSGAEDWLYMYTADDQRVWAYRTGGSGNYWAIRDLDGKVLREYSAHAGWTVDRDYVYRGDKLLAAVTPQGTRHFHLDHLGSVRQVTNASAAQVAFHAYYPFGREATTLGQDNKEQMQFTGHERDLQNTTAGTNSDADDLDYMHARYYNMHVGRFTSVDPARSWDPKAPQSWNRYGYTRNNPLSLVDPDGRQEKKATEEQEMVPLPAGQFAIVFEFPQPTSGTPELRAAAGLMRDTSALAVPLGAKPASKARECGGDRKVRRESLVRGRNPASRGVQRSAMGSGASGRGPPAVGSAPGSDTPPVVGRCVRGVAGSAEAAFSETGCCLQEERHPAVDRQQPEDQASPRSQDLGREEDHLVEEAAHLHREDLTSAVLGW
jgi:RHS repeat-associated protein